MTTKTEDLAPVSERFSFDGQPKPVAHILREMITDPWRFVVLKWNWKSAVFSSLIRAFIFFFVTLRAGWKAALAAFLVELAYRGVTAGFYGGMTQSFRKAEPAWAGAIAVMIILPLSSHSIEFLIHSARHTPHLAANIISSMIFTAISTLFNWYSMRKGSLITGAEGLSVADDLKSMPRLIACFLAAGPVALWRLSLPLLWPAGMSPKRWASEAWTPQPLHEPKDVASD